MEVEVDLLGHASQGWRSRTARGAADEGRNKGRADGQAPGGALGARDRGTGLCGHLVNRLQDPIQPMPCDGMVQCALGR